jgi:hypothetical protein
MGYCWIATLENAIPPPMLIVVVTGGAVVVKASPGAVRLSAVQFSVPVPGVLVAVQLRPLIVMLPVLVDVQAGEMQERVEALLRVVVQVRLPDVLVVAPRGLGSTAMDTGVGGAPLGS